ncbi:hypothetical protein CEXT_752481 [Caerostris extrusa]|uniref:Uncharacterized protein n=1 Tax=Caerostris extrusa TaxID=172846 RepID=A0AAV4X656_CAEEX|nr:hypothetical protein CEXT_752481 [Caerostris extrusa]
MVRGLSPDESVRYKLINITCYDDRYGVAIPRTSDGSNLTPTGKAEINTAFRGSIHNNAGQAIRVTECENLGHDLRKSLMSKS